MFLNKLLANYNLRITKKTTYDDLLKKAFEYADCKQKLDILLAAPLLRRLNKSYSQMELRQDMFVLSQLGFKEEGYFVEFGVANGLDLSNTYLLEKEFSWSGIVSEPAKCWHESILLNRSCHIDTRCVWSESNCRLIFNESNIGELSTIDKFSDSDIHSSFRQNTGNKYEVDTISLTDLLNTYDAPSKIDYLSIDTEGSEYDILSKFDFNRYQFRIITCEHNMNDSREKIYKLLSSKGYSRVYTELSKCDDWYVKNDMV